MTCSPSFFPGSQLAAREGDIHTGGLRDRTRVRVAFHQLKRLALTDPSPLAQADPMIATGIATSERR
jgi:hypothetical protein